MIRRDKSGTMIKNCSPKLTIHIGECLNNGMTKEEVMKKYYWLKDIILQITA